MDTVLLQQRIGHEEFDYQVLLDALREYARPRDKITGLLAKGVIVRVKKGLYVFGERYRRRPIVREVLANLIYGPSYLSLEYALSYYGLIPERVEALTSVTCGRSRSFETPVGVFSYRQVPDAAFETGMDRVELEDGRAFLIAEPEKSLADKIVLDRGTGIGSQAELREYLTVSLRIELSSLRELNPARLIDAANRYRSRKLKMLSRLVERLQKRDKED